MSHLHAFIEHVIWWWAAKLNLQLGYWSRLFQAISYTATLYTHTHTHTHTNTQFFFFLICVRCQAPGAYLHVDGYLYLRKSVLHRLRNGRRHFSLPLLLPQTGDVVAPLAAGEQLRRSRSHNFGFLSLSRSS